MPSHSTQQFQIAGRPGLKTRFGPCGVHLFNRTNGLNVLLDEVSVPSRFWAQAPRQISIALTNTCNLHCSHCFAPKYPATLDKERITSWLDQLDANGCLGIGFGGGEPTLHPHFVELCRHGAQETSLAVTFTTHAHNLDESLASDLAGSVHFIRVSMDGVGSTYESIRGRSFASFRERLRLVRKLSSFGINYVANSRTIRDLDSAAALAEENGATEFLLLPELPARDAKGIDAETLGHLRRWIAQYGGSVRLAISEAASDSFPTCDPLPGENGLAAYAHIDARGILKRTSMDQDGVPIETDGVMAALTLLKTRTKELRK